ncbi:MAG: hypothetical protein RMK80_04315 [Pseudobdellovibrionaceae bacterium]|nr:hypothetical protein [Pseudobdellovibrionaceae bacterium]
MSLVWAEQKKPQDLKPFLYVDEQGRRRLALMGLVKEAQEAIPVHLFPELWDSEAEDPVVVIKQFSQGPQKGWQEWIIKPAEGNGDEALLLVHPERWDVFRIRWSDHRGRFQYDFYWHPATRPLAFLNQLLPDEGLMERARRRFSFLPIQDLKKMSESQQNLYWSLWQKALVVAEEFDQSQSHNVLWIPFRDSGDSSFVSQYLLPPFFGVIGVNLAYGSGASRLDGRECIVAGWVSRFETVGGRTVCKLEGGMRVSGQVVCNPDLFGKNVTISGSSGSNYTEQCVRKVTGQPHLLKSVLSDLSGDLNARKSQLSRVLNERMERCLRHSALDQRSVCEQLLQYQKKILDLSCNASSSESHLPPEVCGSSPSEPSALAASTTPLAPATSTTPSSTETPSSKPNDLPSCEDTLFGLPSSNQGLHCGTENPVQNEQCWNDSSKLKERRYFCHCKSGYGEEYRNTSKPIGCFLKSESKSSTSSRASSKRSKDVTKRDRWFQPWMGVTLAAVFGYTMWYLTQKEMMKQVYNMFTPKTSAPPLPPPGLTPVVPPPPGSVAPPPPVDINRPAPPGVR